MANPELYLSSYQQQINIALIESAGLSIPDVEDITAQELNGKRQDIIVDQDEMDDIAVDVMEAGEFVSILRQCLADPVEAGIKLQALTNRAISNRAEYLLS